MSRWLRAWGPALRIARRDALRARGRSILILVMIALPVTAVVGLDVLGRTADVSAREGLDRHLGRADALVTYQGDNLPVEQSPNMDGFSSASVGPGQESLPEPTAATIAAVLPAGTKVVPLREGDLAVRTDVGVSRPAGVELDLRRPITTGLYELTSGRYPRTVDEVLVSRRLAQRGFSTGRTLTFADGQQATVVGLVASGSTHATCSQSGCTNDLNLVLGLPGSLPLEANGPGDVRSWLVDAPGGVSWAQVRALNATAVFALSRQVVDNPPPVSEVSPQFANTGGGLSGADLSVLAMIVAMALLEVVLLAGPAFAVGVKRMERSLALMAATGGEPPDIRKVVLASGVVLGVAAGAAGVVVGVAGSWLVLPFVQSFSSERFGPFEVVPRDLLVIAACGVLSAIAAALVPAVMASRQDVVAVLAGRRGQTRRPVWSPVLGTMLLGLGIAGAVSGARKPSGGEFLIAGAAVAAVLGMVLLIPLVVAQLGRFARPLPLPLRFAVRDAARQRARTAPAVAAVAAVVAGVVALGVGGTSDTAEAKATYSPSAPMGAGVVSWYSEPDAKVRAGGWDAMVAAVSRQLPGATVHRIQGVPDSIRRVPESIAGGPGEGTVRATVHPAATGERQLLVGADDAATARQGVSFAANFGAALLVGPQSLTDSGVELSPGDRARARTVLARDGIVLFGYTSSVRITSQVLRLQEFPADGNGAISDVGRWTVPATTVQVAGSVLPARGVISAAAARTAGVPVETTSLLVDGVTIDQAAEDRVDEAVAQVDPDSGLFVERGYHDNSVAVALLILGVAGGALVLGGTLTATFLALSDARPDFATMGAVGAAPRTRRMVAAAYALTVGTVGAVLGAAVGFVPGIAVTYPLTSTSWMAPGSTDASGSAIPDHFLDVPWLLILGLVVGLPLLAAVVVAGSTRARLPMVSRLT